MDAHVDTGREDAALAAAAGIVAAIAYFTGRLPLSNIDDYNLLVFQRDYPGALRAALGEATAGRFRPVYWALEGALGALTGSTGTVLHVGRLAFQAAGTAFLVLAARRLGAPRWYAVALGAAGAWCDAALDVWTRTGPSEAFAQPFALAAIWLVLRARGAAGLAAAALAGLTASLSKEAYAPFVAAALLAHAVTSAARPGRRALAAVAVLGAAAQFLPSAVAWIGLRQLPGSYLAHVLAGDGLPPLDALALAAARNVLPGAVGALGLAAAAGRLARARPSGWALEDLLPVAVTAATVLVTLVFGYARMRYLLPLSAALLLLGARALPVPRVSATRAVRAAVAAATVLAVAATGARAITFARTFAAMGRGDERFRNGLASVLAARGGAILLWDFTDLERPLGALAHLGEAGRSGRVEIRLCDVPPPGQEELYERMRAPYARPLGRPAPLVVSAPCLGGPGPVSAERACMLLLPGSPDGPAGYHCFEVPEVAAFLER
jgi:hypothetical protein